MAGYTPLFGSIVTSSIWNESSETRIVWITILALADAHGKVEGSVSGLAPVARVPIESCEKAINRLKAPDKYSRTKEYDGRRIVDIDGGWQILNFTKFREKAKKRTAEYYRNYRKRKQETNTKTNTNTNTNTHTQTGERCATVAKVAKPHLRTYNGDFSTFWYNYPKKVGKGAAYDSWLKIQPSNELIGKITAAVESQKKSAAWQKDKGKYIPNPATWLNQGRWDDVLPKAPPTTSEIFDKFAKEEAEAENATG